jgi:hydroxypyruvate isomerase
MPYSKYQIDRRSARLGSEEKAALPDFAPDLSFTFAELPFVERFHAAARVGFEAIEISTNSHVAPGELARMLHDSRLSLIAADLPGNGEQGTAVDPSRLDDFREAMRIALEYASTVGCRFINCNAGPLIKRAAGGEARRILLENVGYAAHCAMARGISILLETAIVRPRALEHDLSEAVSLLDDVRAPNVALLCNLSEVHEIDDVAAITLSRYLARIGHIRVSGSSGCDRPPIPLDNFFGSIDRIGHHGWIGCGSADCVAAALAWMAHHRVRKRESRWGMPLTAFRSVSGRASR